MHQRLDGYDKRLDRFEKRFDALDARFDELRSYVSFALGQGQMNFMKGNELEETSRAHGAKLADIERRLTVLESPKA